MYKQKMNSDQTIHKHSLQVIHAKHGGGKIQEALRCYEYTPIQVLSSV